jgi:hypothetical protein
MVSSLGMISVEQLGRAEVTPEACAPHTSGLMSVYLNEILGSSGGPSAAAPVAPNIESMDRLHAAGCRVEAWIDGATERHRVIGVTLPRPEIPAFIFCFFHYDDAVALQACDEVIGGIEVEP